MAGIQEISGRGGPYYFADEEGLELHNEKPAEIEASETVKLDLGQHPSRQRTSRHSEQTPAKGQKPTFPHQTGCGFAHRPEVACQRREGGALPVSAVLYPVGRKVGSSELFRSDSAAKADWIPSGTLRYSAVCSLRSQFIFSWSSK